MAILDQISALGKSYYRDMGNLSQQLGGLSSKDPGTEGNPLIVEDKNVRLLPERMNDVYSFMRMETLPYYRLMSKKFDYSNELLGQLVSITSRVWDDGQSDVSNIIDSYEDQIKQLTSDIRVMQEDYIKNLQETFKEEINKLSENYDEAVKKQTEELRKQQQDNGGNSGGDWKNKVAAAVTGIVTFAGKTALNLGTRYLQRAEQLFEEQDKRVDTLMKNYGYSVEQARRISANEMTRSGISPYERYTKQQQMQRTWNAQRQALDLGFASQGQLDVAARQIRYMDEVIPNLNFQATELFKSVNRQIDQTGKTTDNLFASIRKASKNLAVDPSTVLSTADTFTKYFKLIKKNTYEFQQGMTKVINTTAKLEDNFINAQDEYAKATQFGFTTLSDLSPEQIQQNSILASYAGLNFEDFRNMARMDPSQYVEMRQLGLKNYLSSMGINKAEDLTETSLYQLRTIGVTGYQEIVDALNAGFSDLNKSQKKLDKNAGVDDYNAKVAIDQSESQWNKWNEMYGGYYPEYQKRLEKIDKGILDNKNLRNINDTLKEKTYGLYGVGGAAQSLNTFITGGALASLLWKIASFLKIGGNGAGGSGGAGGTVGTLGKIGAGVQIAGGLAAAGYGAYGIYQGGKGLSEQGLGLRDLNKNEIGLGVGTGVAGLTAAGAGIATLAGVSAGPLGWVALALAGAGAAAIAYTESEKKRLDFSEGLRKKLQEENNYYLNTIDSSSDQLDKLKESVFGSEEKFNNLISKIGSSEDTTTVIGSLSGLSLSSDELKRIIGENKESPGSVIMSAIGLKDAMDENSPLYKKLADEDGSGQLYYYLKALQELTKATDEQKNAITGKSGQYVSTIQDAEIDRAIKSLTNRFYKGVANGGTIDYGKGDWNVLESYVNQGLLNKDVWNKVTADFKIDNNDLWKLFSGNKGIGFQINNAGNASQYRKDLLSKESGVSLTSDKDLIKRSQEIQPLISYFQTPATQNVLADMVTFAGQPYSSDEVLDNVLIMPMSKYPKDKIRELVSNLKTLSAADNNSDTLSSLLQEDNYGFTRMIDSYGNLDKFIDKLEETNNFRKSKGLSSYAVGSSYIENDQLALIHKGERILTAEQNNIISNDSLVSGITGRKLIDVIMGNNQIRENEYEMSSNQLALDKKSLDENSKLNTTSDKISKSLDALNNVKLPNIWNKLHESFTSLVKVIEPISEVFNKITEDDLASLSTNGGPGGPSDINPYSKWRVSSSFGPRAGRFHYGTDYAANEGSNILAPMSGTVTLNDFESNGYGNWLRLLGDNGYTFIFGHMRERSNLKVGQHVNYGDLIGHVGSTGRSTGPHLHFEVRKPDGTAMNDQDYWKSPDSKSSAKSGIVRNLLSMISEKLSSNYNGVDLGYMREKEVGTRGPDGYRKVAKLIGDEWGYGAYAFTSKGSMDNALSLVKWSKDNGFSDLYELLGSGKVHGSGGALKSYWENAFDTKKSRFIKLQNEYEYQNYVKPMLDKHGSILSALGPEVTAVAAGHNNWLGRGGLNKVFGLMKGNDAQSYMDAVRSYVRGLGNYNLYKAGFENRMNSEAKYLGVHRTGLTNVPYDGYRAVLHSGEQVLTKREADLWRSRNYTAMEAIASQTIPQVPEVYVDNSDVVDAIEKLAKIVENGFNSINPESGKSQIKQSRSRNNSILNYT